ncbi:hypothetical protein GH714_032273 [Hevea brasiliensis]|uniref:RNase H type-1 domain-containing protein n=1 Tax=Hevea brasiliensis TaxID=3981 RepID=A0A6A6L584_HEVBR|nr:hypothetical protein GH714_032273 [Hevea brasiliensis]
MDGRAEGWQKPVLGRIKCNFDASIFVGENLTGFAAVVRNDTGHFVLEMSGFRSGNFSPPVAEALALRETLLWLHNQGLDHVDVEMDCLSLFTEIAMDFLAICLFLATRLSLSLQDRIPKSIDFAGVDMNSSNIVLVCTEISSPETTMMILNSLETVILQYSSGNSTLAGAISAGTSSSTCFRQVAV